MEELSRQTVKDVYEDGWPDPDPQWRPVSISLTNRLLRILDGLIEESNCEYDNRSALVRAAIYDWLEREEDGIERPMLYQEKEDAGVPAASEGG